MSNEFIQPQQLIDDLTFKLNTLNQSKIAPRDLPEPQKLFSPLIALWRNRIDFETSNYLKMGKPAFLLEEVANQDIQKIKITNNFNSNSTLPTFTELPTGTILDNFYELCEEYGISREAIEGARELADSEMLQGIEIQSEKDSTLLLSGEVNYLQGKQYLISISWNFIKSREIYYLKKG